MNGGGQSRFENGRYIAPRTHVERLKLWRVFETWDECILYERNRAKRWRIQSQGGYYLVLDLYL